VPTRSVEVTGLLKAWSGGDPAALERLADQVYNELRRIARRYMRNERAGNTLQTTALGNEVYLRVLGALRTVTKRLPDGVLSGLASLLNLVLDAYIPLCRAFPLPMRAYMLNHLGRLDRRMRKLTVFDQLNPRHAKYYREAEARALVADAGFEDVRTYHRHGYSWTVIGSKSGG